MASTAPAPTPPPPPSTGSSSTASRLHGKPRVVSIHEALKHIVSGSTVCIGGFGACGAPLELLQRIPSLPIHDLTLVVCTVFGQDYGVGPLAEAGQLSRVVTGFIDGDVPSFANKLYGGALDLELCPLGTLTARLQAGGTGMPAFYTPVGFGTAVEKGGLPMRFASDGSRNVTRYSARRETRCVNGVWCCLETALKPDVALVRAWKADRRGNLIFRGTARNMNLAAARAAAVCVVEVEELVECGELDANAIHLPGLYVSCVVHIPHAQLRFDFGGYMHKVLMPKASVTDAVHTASAAARSDNNGASMDDADADTNEDKSEAVRLAASTATDTTTTIKDEMNERKHRIARRAALELHDGCILTIGVGVPTLVPSYIPTEMDVFVVSDNGLLGVGPYPRNAYEVDADVVNTSRQPVTAQVNAGACFVDFVECGGIIGGGHVDVVMLGALEVSESGDLASWAVPGQRLHGMGAAMDLVQGGCRVVALMTHTSSSSSSSSSSSGGSESKSRSKLVHECRAPLTGAGVVDVIVTDLAVFEVLKPKTGARTLRMTELAAGVTVEEVRAQTEADFEVSTTLQTMRQAAPSPALHVGPREVSKQEKS